MNVLPEPVTPISTCSALPTANALRPRRLNRLRLVAGRLKRAGQLEFHEFVRGLADNRDSSPNATNHVFLGIQPDLVNQGPGVMGVGCGVWG